MNLQEFELKYQGIGSRENIVITCEKCNTPRTVQKHKAKNNIKKNGRYVCQPCRAAEASPLRVMTPEGRAAQSAATSYPRSEETKAKMAAAKRAFFQTPEGVTFKKKLSVLASLGHAANKFENAKRNGWHLSSKNGKPIFYGSSYELRLCVLLDTDDDVLEYETQICYEVDGRGRCLDFLVTYKNGRKLAIEVKPSSRLTEEAVIAQIADSQANADSHEWDFAVYTEANLGMNEWQLRVWADEYRTKQGDFDWVAFRKQRNSEKVKRHYAKKIATDKVKVWCDFCQTTHEALRLTYEKNIARNGRYICEREGGHIAGSKPKKKKVNPYADQGKKECTKCGQVKPFEDFGFDSSRSDGYSNKCRECRSTKKA